MKLLLIAQLLFVLSVLGLSIYGLGLAFQASVVLGIAALFLEPAPLILGLAALCGHPELARTIASAFGLG